MVTTRRRFIQNSQTKEPIKEEEDNNPVYEISSSSDDSDSDDDDSEYDSTFDVVEETQSKFSRLSILKKKTKPRVDKDVEMDEVDGDEMEVIVPEFDEKDEKSFETVLEIIKVGQVEKLKLEQCKVYLRKYGLRLTGKKDTLILRIKEHLEIQNGGGEKKYPLSSFVLNCKGDACMGDVVIFEQNVYEMFNIASRSAGGPPCGKRIAAGRIAKESYGVAKQQHTFTIEVLWSKGEKPFPPLHPLLIKGRNLYRLKTLRQRWEDEGERERVLMEKHSRGCVARSDREARIQQKEMRKTLKANRGFRENEPKKDKKDQEPMKLGSSGQVELQPQKKPVQINSMQRFHIGHGNPAIPLIHSYPIKIDCQKPCNWKEISGVSQTSVNSSTFHLNHGTHNVQPAKGYAIRTNYRPNLTSRNNHPPMTQMRRHPIASKNHYYPPASPRHGKHLASMNNQPPLPLSLKAWYKSKIWTVISEKQALPSKGSTMAEARAATTKILPVLCQGSMETSASSCI